MTDRELLELAAKAAGILPLPDGKELDAAPDGGLMICGGGEVKYWNPLTDDGDALRLAVKLGDTFLVKVGICRQIDKTFCHIDSVATLVKLGICRQIDKTFCHIDSVATRENLGTDPYAATRRAIVRAAAEIGRNMK